MKRNIVWTIFLFATLMLGLATGASAQVPRTCSLAGVAGEWAPTLTGTVIPPTGPVLFAGIQRLTIDAAGNVSGTQTASLGGSLREETIQGNITVNSDCAGTLTEGIYGQSGNLSRTAVWAVVLVDNEREMRAIVKSIVLADGTPVPAVITIDSKKLFHGVLF
jgi:hypothetical protein